MKPEDIINALGDISDDILLQANLPIRRRSYKKLIVILASAVLLICAFTIPLAMQRDTAPEPADIPSDVINALDKDPVTPPHIPVGDNGSENESYITDEAPSDFSDPSTDTETSYPDIETSDMIFPEEPITPEKPITPEEPTVKPIVPDTPVEPGDSDISSPDEPDTEISTPPAEGDISEPDNDDPSEPTPDIPTEPETPPESDNCLDIYGKMDGIEGVPDCEPDSGLKPEINFIKTLSPSDSETLLSLVDLIAVPENAAKLEGAGDSTVESEPSSGEIVIATEERIYLLGFYTDYQYSILSMDREIYIYSSRLGGKDYLLRDGDSLYYLPYDEFTVIEYIIWGID